MTDQKKIIDALVDELTETKTGAKIADACANLALEMIVCLHRALQEQGTGNLPKVVDLLKDTTAKAGFFNNLPAQFALNEIAKYLTYNTEEATPNLVMDNQVLRERMVKMIREEIQCKVLPKSADN